MRGFPLSCCLSLGKAWLILSALALSLVLPPQPCGAQTRGPYRVQVNDVLELLFFKNTELNQVRTVGPDGVIALQLVGSVPVVGRTVDEITDQITALYAKELVNPQVTVAVKEFSGLKVYVSGEVGVPGIQVYRGGLTAIQAIVAAGGFRPTARLDSILLIRQGPDGMPVGSIHDLGRVLKHAEFSLDVALVPTDIVFVPRSRIANVNRFIEQYFRNMWPIPVGIGWYFSAP